MPLFYQHNINQGTRLGIWKIEEDADFFLRKVPIHRAISHPHKRLQHLAGRYLMQHLFPDFPYSLIRLADTRKPFLINEAYHFSISHCGDFAAAIVSKHNRVGMDIELVKPMIRKIAGKFITEIEMQAVHQTHPLLFSAADDTSDRNDEILTLCWSAKEAMFKWFGEGGVDFKNHMKITAVSDTCQEGWFQCSFSKTDVIHVLVHFRRFEGLMLTWLVT